MSLSRLVWGRQYTGLCILFSWSWYIVTITIIYILLTFWNCIVLSLFVFLIHKISGKTKKDTKHIIITLFCHVTHIIFSREVYSFIDLIELSIQTILHRVQYIRVGKDVGEIILKRIYSYFFTI